MKTIEPPYKILSVWEREWRFFESDEMLAATEIFDALLENHGGWGGAWSQPLAAALREFLLKYPNHIDALHHYASYLLDGDQLIEALAFSQTAVAIGMRAFPKEFVIGKDRLCTGYVQNRPYLRAMHGLMLAQKAVNLTEEAIRTGEMCLALDTNDRMGAREELVLCLIESNRDEAAISLFENPAYKETFFGAGYLHALALLRVGQRGKARASLKHYLEYYPLIAKFILDKSAVRPSDDNRFGVAVGSPMEGWLYAHKIGHFWRKNRAAMKFLREEADPYANRGWSREIKNDGLILKAQPHPRDHTDN